MAPMSHLRWPSAVCANFWVSFRASLPISDSTTNNFTRHFAAISTEARVVSQSIRRLQPLFDLS